MTRFHKPSAFFVVMAVWVLATVLCGAAQAARPVVKKIETDSAKDKFTLRVFLNTRLAPRVFALDVRGENPRVVVDFNKAAGAGRLPARIKTVSPMVRAVRVGVHKTPKPKIRLVLDLVPGQVYQVDQWFRRDINSYVMVISAQ